MVKLVWVTRGVFVYTTEYAGTGISAQFGKGQSVNNDDDANGGEGGHGSSWDIALTNSSLMDGLTVGAGYGSISNANGAQNEGSSDVDEHYTGFCNLLNGSSNYWLPGINERRQYNQWY
jgi:hypothetical protein